MSAPSPSPMPVAKTEQADMGRKSSIPPVDDRLQPSAASTSASASASTSTSTLKGGGEKEKQASMTTAKPSLRRELSIEDQSSRMPLRKILIVYLGIGLALLVSFMDQTAVSTAAPNISTDLGGSETMSWIGTSFFVANCAFQLVYGRLSDIVGRKVMLQIALALLALGNLLCSFAKTPVQLYVFRSISGIGGGGINNIAMVIVSDVVPLKERGKYQGLVSAACSLGNAFGPFLGGGLATAGQWRWLFRITTIFGVLIIGMIHLIIPLKPVTGSAKEKLARIDYLGVALSAASIVLLLVPISGGGSTFAWNSPTVIGLLVGGVVAGVAFVLVEWRVAKLPILPLRLFKLRTPTVVNVQSFFIGLIYYGNIFYVPIYLQYVKGYSALVSGALNLAGTFPQALWGILAGLYISKTNHYKRIIIGSAVIWTLGAGLQILWNADSSIGMALGFLIISSVGVGGSLQTTMIAALATSPSKDRAVVTGSRNFFRTMGGSFGLACANAIYQPSVTSHLLAISSLTNDQRSDLLSSALANLDTLPPSTVREVRQAYSHALRLVFMFFTAVGAVCIVLSLFIEEVKFAKDNAALEAERQKSKGRKKSDVESKAVSDSHEKSPTIDDEEQAIVPHVTLEAEDRTAMGSGSSSSETLGPGGLSASPSMSMGAG